MNDYIFTAILKKRILLLKEAEEMTMVGMVTHKFVNFVEWDIKQILEERETMRQLLQDSIALLPTGCEHAKRIATFLGT